MQEPPKPPSIRRRAQVPAVQALGLGLLGAVIASGLALRPEGALAQIGRVAAFYLFLMLAFRLSGKRELSSFSPLELITLMLIPEIASPALSGERPLSTALVGVSALLALVFVSSLLSHRFRSVEALVESKPCVLVRDGALCEDAMNDERITADELYSEMHSHGLADLSEVRWAILESGGEIAFIRKDGAGTDASRERTSPSAEL